MKVRAQAGAKVFFFGEYAALLGGPAALMSFAPPYIFEAEFQSDFVSKAQSNSPSDLQNHFRGMHSDSPAARYLFQKLTDGDLPPGEYSLTASARSLPFRGFGSSTVEYLSILALEKELTTKHTMNESGLKSPFANSRPTTTGRLSINHENLDTYRRFAGGTGRLPSGYDLLVQNTGGVQAIQHFEIDAEKSRELKSLLDSHLVGIFHTGRKLATHEAIRELNSESLQKIKIRAQKCWQNISKPIEFWVAMDDFVEELQACGWTQVESSKVLQKLRQDQRVHFAKACGAMGADSILVVLKAEEKSSFAFYDFEAPEYGLSFVGSNENLSPPFQFERLV